MTTKSQSVSAIRAVQFMRELLNAVECLSMVSEIHGKRTLVDLMYLQHAILTHEFIDMPEDSPSKAVMIIQNLPSGTLWMKYVRMGTQVGASITQDLTPMNDHYIIQQKKNILPVLYGPFESDKSRLTEVVKLLVDAPEDAFMRLTVPQGIEPHIACFTGVEVDDELLAQLKDNLVEEIG